MQSINQKLPSHPDRMVVHLRLFKRLHKNLMPLIHMILEETVCGNVVFEWPAFNRWWKRKEVKSMISKFGLSMVDLMDAGLV